MKKELRRKSTFQNVENVGLKDLNSVRSFLALLRSERLPTKREQKEAAFDGLRLMSIESLLQPPVVKGHRGELSQLIRKFGRQNPSEIESVWDEIVWLLSQLARPEKNLSASEVVSHLDSLRRFVAWESVTQIEAKCMVAYKQRVSSVIHQASRGNREAVLKLIRLDPKFLMDRCTRKVINEALADSDTQFVDQLSLALRSRFFPNGKNLVRLSIYMLLAIDPELPSLYELHRLLDPSGEIFEGTYAFEKFVARCKAQYRTLVPDER